MEAEAASFLVGTWFPALATAWVPARARADLESAGRRNVVGSVHVWCDDRPHKPCATAQGTYVLPL